MLRGIKMSSNGPTTSVGRLEKQHWLGRHRHPGFRRMIRVIESDTNDFAGSVNRSTPAVTLLDLGKQFCFIRFSGTPRDSPTRILRRMPGSNLGSTRTNPCVFHPASLQAFLCLEVRNGSDASYAPRDDRTASEKISIPLRNTWQMPRGGSVGVS